MEKKEILTRISECDVIYHVPGQSDRSAMPIGDGELAASIWVTGDGILHGYLARTDALSELDRTVKLGEILVELRPMQFPAGVYTQQLCVADGSIRIHGRDCDLQIWMERETHSLCVSGTKTAAVTVTADYRTWRTEPHVPFGEFQNQSEIFESADVVERTGNTILFYHRNGPSLVPETAQLQGLGDHLELVPDLLKNRIFGGLLELDCREDGFFLRVTTHSEQTTPEEFRRALHLTAARGLLPEASQQRERARWHTYWSKSYLFVRGDTPAENHYDPSLVPCIREPMEYTCACQSPVTRAYVLTKYMMACCSTGSMPILYSGMLFNLCPGLDRHYDSLNFGTVFTAQPQEQFRTVNPDERSWCREHLWQNLRHPYLSCLARGETEPLCVLFRYFARFHALDRLRAERYYHAAGQHNTEMTLSCGLQTPEIYGTQREGMPQGYAKNRWGGAIDISPGLELCSLMLDYADFTGDTAFLQQECLPYFYDLLRYVETRFPVLEQAHMKIGPLNCIETYRDTINPLPVVAGLRSTLGRVLQLDQQLVEKRAYFQAYLDKLPQIPQNDRYLQPAEQYEEARYNVEVPELYAMYPFRLYAFDQPEVELAKRTYWEKTRKFQIDRSFCIGETPQTPSCSGWQYTGAAAAILGLAEESARILCANCALLNPGTRFPAMWGPIYDAVPDTDHGANILSQLQLMVMQTVGDTIYLLPAFPQNWEVEFKLYADSQTCVEAAWKNGAWNLEQGEGKNLVFPGVT